MSALTANTVRSSKNVFSGPSSFKVGAAVHIYQGGAVGLHPVTKLAKAYQTPDIFIGFAYEECDNSAGAAGAEELLVNTSGDWLITLSSVADADIGKAVYAITDNDFSLLGHPDGFIGRVIAKTATNECFVQLKMPNEKTTRADSGSLEYMYKAGGDVFVTGATAGQGPAGDFQTRSALGLGSVVDGATGAYSGEFDAVAEIASVGIETPIVLSNTKGITFEIDFHMEQIGDASLLDVDVGLFNVIDATARANLDDASVTKLFGFHMDGNSANILLQSDDNSTDVAPVDTTIDNVTTAKAWKRLVGIVRADGSCEGWIDGTRVCDGTTGAATTFSVGSTAANFGFLAGMEKTSDDTVGEINIAYARVCGARAA